MSDSMNSSNPEQITDAPPSSKARGFAAMDQAQQRLIASMGGKAAHKSGRAHQFTSEEAKKAGTKGGRASQRGAMRGGGE